MSQAPVATTTPTGLTGLLVPLSDRQLLLPNVAVAELIAFRAPQISEGMPDWFLGQIAWRDLRLPLLSFEAASSGQAQLGEGARVAVLNALGGRPKVKFIALLVQGIPRSVKIASDLPAVDVELAPLELGAARVGDDVVRIPDLIGLEQLLADAGLI
ncbi:MAG: chemotaxis protein CheW [Gammaproteobacteria bacterium]|jgi:chemosensory pili system protein ChpC|nr:chemotaxis protein CheW [Gammaproteobacteria bacterium]MBU1490156.1 chemotaxis protein CheW [Gammaproteobacteria bacterium]MBU2067376.1 chemotaxis protein CheW [Gammaproteobacteria bacterium]MBU2140686.1 chemotaxis protein CheW [Gammaproteobacteria bacterium]MBU2218014.1 chemotaxis protein CheW [Gammaproteobacteria bacterium]